MPLTSIDTRCCIAGGGPAGMMLGVLLARAGVDVLVLEKHRDFLRDFRGDTVHPSTLELMHELGWLEAFLQRPHQKIREVGGRFGDERLTIADFSHLPTTCRFLVLMPQWEFLDFLAAQGRRYPTFHLMMDAEVLELLIEDERIVGIRARTADGVVGVRAVLTIGADGRQSTVREQAGLAVDEFGVPIDALWLRLSRRPDDPEQTLGHLRNGHVFVTLPRGDYWQCAFVIPKGGYEEMRNVGMPALRASIVDIVPFFRDRVEELTDWDQVKLLVVKVNRLRQWHRPGLLCIGDAAHAMSPIGGVGINLAIQDAVAAANVLAEPLRIRPSSASPVHALLDRALEAVQRRRQFPTRITQWFQLQAQNRVIGPTLRVRPRSTEGSRYGGDATRSSLPLPVRLLRDHPVLRRIPARLIGLGVRPEHIRTPDVFVDRQPQPD